MLPRITPIAPIRIKAPIDDPDFIAELKHDGFRALAYIESGAARLISRKQIVYKSKPFISLCTLLAKLPVTNAILDGELICLDGDGRSQFMELMRRRRQDVCYYAFDLLWADGSDLRQLPLLERKRQLRALIHHKPDFCMPITSLAKPSSSSRRVVPAILKVSSLNIVGAPTPMRHGHG